MSVVDYLSFLFVIVGFAAVWDTFWLTRVRPWLAVRFGWRAVSPDERIPFHGWAGAAAFMAVFFILLPRFWVAAGY